MKNYLIILFISCVGFANAQPKHYYSLGAKHSGICFGNSERYNGIRLNLWDKDVEFIGDISNQNILSNKSVFNGIEISGYSMTQHLNGISIGVVGSNAAKINGISVSGFFSGTKNTNGILISGLASSCERVNGLLIVGLFGGASKLNGVGVSLIELCDTVNGLWIGGVAFGRKYDNSFSVLNGVTIGYVNMMDKINGVSINFIFCENRVTNGVAISLLKNKTQELHGLQIGLWNVALNNPKLFRRMPFINFHL